MPNTMTKIVFSPEARQDLSETGDYIAYRLRNKSAARHLLTRIQDTVMSLSQFPESGTPLVLSSPNIAYRYLICGSYMLFYYISENVVHIDRILYGRRDYLAILFGDEFSEESESK